MKAAYEFSQRFVNSFLVLCLFCFALTILSGCGGVGTWAGALSGTWTWDGKDGDRWYAWTAENGRRAEWQDEIKFSGKKTVTLTHYVRSVTFDDSGSFHSPDQYWDIDFANRIELIDVEVNLGPVPDMRGIEYNRLARYILRGTYSLSDNKDKIELKFVGGRGDEILVFSFESTENTMTIGGRRFTRK